MKRMKTISLLLALSLVAVVSTVSATHEDSDCEVETETAVTEVGPIYVTDDTWVYEESNGVPGLQRGGTSPVLGDTDPEAENCGHGPDTLRV